MKQESLPLNIDALILTFAFLLANLRASIFIHIFPDTSTLLGPAWIEIALWLLLIVVMVYSLVRENQISLYLMNWRKNWFLVFFIMLALASAFWSVAPVATIFRVLELTCASLIGAYVGMRYGAAQLMEFLFWFGAVLLILSTAMAFAAPKAGTMYWPPFDGAWRGLFWHRNHLASIAALFSIVFLCRAIPALERKDGKWILDAIFYVLSLIVLFYAESATGYILFIALNFLVVFAWVWLKVNQSLRSQHYYLIFVLVGTGMVLILSNLDVVFGLFNRNTTLTGRVGLWDGLLNGMVAQYLWWGHGFGAVWTLDSFRETVRHQIGWPSQPLIADNGFLDILLHVGLIGLSILLVILLIATLQAFRHAISKKNLADCFPLFFICYVFLANIPFSLIAETEVFIWFLIVTILIMTMPSRSLVGEIG